MLFSICCICYLCYRSSQLILWHASSLCCLARNCLYDIIMSWVSRSILSQPAVTQLNVQRWQLTSKPMQQQHIPRHAHKHWCVTIFNTLQACLWCRWVAYSQLLLRVSLNWCSAECISYTALPVEACINMWCCFQVLEWLEWQWQKSWSYVHKPDIKWNNETGIRKRCVMSVWWEACLPEYRQYPLLQQLELHIPFQWQLQDQ